MIISCFGASSPLGKRLVKQLIWMGHIVKVYGRNLYEYDLQDENLSLIIGSVFDEDEVYSAILGSDVIFSTLEAGTDDNDKTITLGTSKILSGMTKASVSRIVMCGSGYIIKDESGKYIFESADLPDNQLAVTKQHLNALRQLERSDLSWTLFCPINIIEGDPTGHAKVEEYIAFPGLNQTVTNGELARLMIECAEKGLFQKQLVTIRTYNL